MESQVYRHAQQVKIGTGDSQFVLIVIIFVEEFSYVQLWETSTGWWEDYRDLPNGSGSNI